MQPVDMPSDEELEQMAPRDLLRLGIDLHNRGHHFEAHEAWEAVWKGAPDVLRPFYQGLIQVAAALVHLFRNEYPGTHRLLREGTAKLDAYRPDFLGLWVARFVDAALVARTRLLQLGERRFREFDRDLVPKVQPLDGGIERRLGGAGRAVHYLEWPGHGPAVVLVHAPGLTGRLWLPIAARLSPAYRVLAPDLPGHGESDPWPGGLDAALDALTAWIATAAPDAEAVVGNGFASGLAVHLARETGALAVVVAPDEQTGPADAEAARQRRTVWGNLWEMFEAFRLTAPYHRWRADLLWSYVEEGSRTLEDGRLELRCSGETEAALLGPGTGVADHLSLPQSPLTEPPLAAQALRHLLDTRY